MAGVSADVEFDPFSLECMEDPYPTYRAMLEDAPVYHNARRGFWALSRFADVQHAARDWETFSNRGGVDLSGSVSWSGTAASLAGILRGTMSSDGSSVTSSRQRAF